MKPNLRNTLALVGLAVVAVSMLVFSRSKERTREEVYFGKPLSEWLIDLGTNPSDNDARKAFIAAGSKAVPCLLQALA